MINTDQNYLLMIEPEFRLTCEGVVDDTTRIAQIVLNHCWKSDYSYRGQHTAFPKVYSDNTDYFTPCGRTTHSLLPYYVRYCRTSVTEAEMKKLFEEFACILQNKFVYTEPVSIRIRAEYQNLLGNPVNQHGVPTSWDSVVYKTLRDFPDTLSELLLISNHTE